MTPPHRPYSLSHTAVRAGTVTPPSVALSGSRMSAVTSGRLEVALATLQSGKENFIAASARITDVDLVEESALLARNQIRQQASSALLAQANQQPRIALQLLPRRFCCHAPASDPAHTGLDLNH